MTLANNDPSWIRNLGSPAYAFDFANRRYSGLGVWHGATGGIAKYTPDLFYYSGSSVAGNSLYVQWKDGILRQSANSATASQLRISDYGLWIEGGPGLSHNYCLQCRDLTQGVWTASNMTVAHTATGADNVANSASLLTATANNATVNQSLSINGIASAAIVVAGTGYVANEVDTLSTATGTASTVGQIKVLTVSTGIPQTISVQTAGAYSALPTNPVAQGSSTGAGVGLTVNLTWKTYTLSAWIKRVTGTGTVSLAYDGSTYTDISGSINTTSYRQVRITTTALAAPTLSIRLGTSGDVVAVDFVQLEDDDQATSPIVSAASVNLRGPENIFIGTNGTNFNAGWQMINNTQTSTPMSYLFVYSGNFSTTLPHGLITTDTPFQVTAAAGGGVATAILVSGHTLVSTATDTTGLYLNTTGAGAVNKLVFSSDGTGAKICINGGALTKSSTVVPPTSLAGGTHNNILNNGSNVLPANGYMVMFACWQRALSDGECVLYSTVTNQQ